MASRERPVSGRGRSPHSKGDRSVVMRAAGGMTRWCGRGSKGRDEHGGQGFVLEFRLWRFWGKGGVTGDEGCGVAALAR